jgi:starch phosphorylase
MEREQLRRQGATAFKVELAGELLNPEALTIGFARRFAPYKRATLLLRDMDRLVRILSEKGKPVQFLFAGKAHPKDHFGKELIRSIVLAAKKPELASRIVFLEDYNLATARYLLQGVDVWLNTPRRPKEASGTSGMKAVANGALHLSTRDGWWAEVEAEGLGWTIGAGEEYEEDQYDYQDDVEARALYDLLENEVIPAFYQRGKDNIPRVWIRMMKRSMSKLCPSFNSNRMVRQYAERYYIPAMKHFRRLSDDNLNGARKLAEWKDFLRSNWGKTALVRFEADVGEETSVGSAWEVRAWVRLAPLLPQDVSVEVVHGRIGKDFAIEDETAVPMRYVSTDEGNVCLFRGVIPCVHGGKHGIAMRMIPWHRDLANPYQTGLIRIIEA